MAPAQAGNGMGVVVGKDDGSSVATTTLAGRRTGRRRSSSPWSWTRGAPHCTPPRRSPTNVVVRLPEVRGVHIALVQERKPTCPAGLIQRPWPGPTLWLDRPQMTTARTRSASLARERHRVVVVGAVVAIVVGFALGLGWRRRGSGRVSTRPPPPPLVVVVVVVVVRVTRRWLRVGGGRSRGLSTRDGPDRRS